MIPFAMVSLHFVNLFSLCFSLLPCLTVSGPILKHTVFPNFTASHLSFLDYNGDFLTSNNGTFTASIRASVVTSSFSTYYFSIIHKRSETIIWTANRDRPISNSAELRLTVNGIFITDDSGKFTIWSTPPFDSPVGALQLLETGNLVLVDNRNASLWESFNYPTDTIVMGQHLLVGKSLVASAADANFSMGNYRLSVSSEDLIMQWMGQTYWKMSMQANAYKFSNNPVSYMEINSTGLNLYGDDGTLVIQVLLNASSLKIAKMRPEGRFTIMSFMREEWVEEVVAPVEDCRIPMICGKLGLCQTTRAVCSCPSEFYRSYGSNAGCVPADNSLSLPAACDSNGNGLELNSTLVSYMKLDDGMSYFANDLVDPVKHGVNVSICQDICSRNCYCLGIFHGNFSGSCYLLQNYLGSIYHRIDQDLIGYIKTSSTSSPKISNKKDNSFPRTAMVLIPLFGFFLLVTILILTFLRLCKTRPSKVAVGRNLDRWSSSSSSPELNIITLPGLPIRFDFQELISATENFKTQIGSGGFGTVYRGTMPDETVVAVKKITNLGTRGKKEFLTETAIIGSIRHVNLVRLKGFCIQGQLRFLVYEYMNKGSLERLLFGTGPVLKWQERLNIALGTAKGLAYLHRECHHKIIHCDIKPDNILLHGERSVKISDFGLSKLLDHQKSSKLLTTMRGTRGYIAPEWLTSYGITDKSDVYSFGMVLLEIVNGRRNWSLLTQTSETSKSGSNGPSSSSSLETRSIFFPAMALKMHKQKRYLELVDQRLEEKVTSEEVEKLVRVALCCVQIVPELRPTMAEVVSMLENRLPPGEPMVDALNFL
ncbi:hypothetical protein FNV43_RR10585 [Rhamnella rubrinervis]|uniref:Receptor-like serine/threonine-protein kinase n=1 Tax=Rhamnella rubrinervis TaxID=2594499 RepID=A0A8K0H4G5_9ROSA|nr:hypothetical protein FNV43_RR10585 [Rhamnella rubrinervis]